MAAPVPQPNVFQPWQTEHMPDCPHRSDINFQGFHTLREGFHGTHDVLLDEAIYAKRLFEHFPRFLAQGLTDEVIILAVCNAGWTSTMHGNEDSQIPTRMDINGVMMARLPQRQCSACISDDAVEIFQWLQGSAVFSSTDQSTVLRILLPSPTKTEFRDVPEDVPTQQQMDRLAEAFHHYRGHSWKTSVSLYYPKDMETFIRLDCDNFVTIGDEKASTRINLMHPNYKHNIYPRVL